MNTCIIEGGSIEGVVLVFPKCTRGKGESPINLPAVMELGRHAPCVLTILFIEQWPVAIQCALFDNYDLSSFKYITNMIPNILNLFDGRGEVMDQKLMYAFRGWIGFVAFMDLGAAGRCFIEAKSFFGSHSNLNAVTFQDTDSDEPTLPRILGYFSILKAIALAHCTLFIHYKPLISLGICSLALAIYMNLSEALYYHSTTLNFYIVFPSVLNALTLIGLLLIPRHLLEPQVVNEDENVELLRQAAVLRRKRHNKKEA